MQLHTVLYEYVILTHLSSPHITCHLPLRTQQLQLQLQAAAAADIPELNRLDSHKYFYV